MIKKLKFIMLAGITTFFSGNLYSQSAASSLSSSQNSVISEINASGTLVQGMIYISNNTPTALKFHLRLKDCFDLDKQAVQACQVLSIDKSDCSGLQEIDIEDFNNPKTVLQKFCFDSSDSDAGAGFVAFVEGSRENGFTIKVLSLFTLEDDKYVYELNTVAPIAC